MATRAPSQSPITHKASISQLNWLPGVAIALLGLGSVVLLQRPQLAALTRSSEQLSSETLQQELAQTERNLTLLKQLPSLGFSNLISDWAFLQFLQYFGDDAARDKTNYALSPDFLEIVLDRDPYFLDGYLFLSGSSSLYAGRPDRTVEIIEQNLPRLNPRLPEQAHYIWSYKAIDELLFLGDSDAARESFQKAADWARVYDDPQSQNLAASFSRTVEYLETNPDSKLAQISAWSMVLANALDDGARAVALQRMQALGATLEPASDGRFRIILPAEDPSQSAEASESPVEGEAGPAADSSDGSDVEASEASE